MPKSPQGLLDLHYLPCPYRQGASRRDAPASSCRVKACQAIQQSLQYIGRRRAIDRLGAALAAEVGLDHASRHRGRAQPLIPETDLRIVELQEIMREGPGCLGARAFAAIHVDRQAEDQRAD